MYCKQIETSFCPAIVNRVSKRTRGTTPTDNCIKTLLKMI